MRKPVTYRLRDLSHFQFLRVGFLCVELWTVIRAYGVLVEIRCDHESEDNVETRKKNLEVRQRAEQQGFGVQGSRILQEKSQRRPYLPCGITQVI